MKIINGKIVDDERILLEELGATNIDLENLINNYRYTFDYNGKHYTLAHIVNVYGMSVNFWDLYMPSEEGTSRTMKEFTSLEQAIEFLKEDK